MTEEKIVKILVKAVQEKPNLTIRGGESLNPIVEALFAVFREQLTDEQIMKIINEEGEIRNVLALDSLIDYIPEIKRQEFKQKIDSISSQEIIDLAALYIAENKRIGDGNVLKPISDFENSKYCLRALKKIDSSEVYVRESSASGLEKNALKIKKRKIISAAVLSATLGFGIYNISTSEKVRESISFFLNKTHLNHEIHNLSTQLSDLERKLEIAKTEFESEKGLQKYEMDSKEFGQPDAFKKKFDEISKTSEMKSILLVYKNFDINQVRFVYKDRIDK